ncbi:MAG: DUF5615 family PIN-like protein [Gemmatimonadota bacterium]
MIWLLLDRTIAPSLQAELEARGVRAIHAAEEEFAAADARTLLESAIEDECLLVTRNYADFTDLAAAYRHAGREFPGVLFVPVSDVADSVGDEAARIVEWVAAGGPETARNACRWLD